MRPSLKTGSFREPALVNTLVLLLAAVVCLTANTGRSQTALLANNGGSMQLGTVGLAAGGAGATFTGPGNFGAMLEPGNNFDTTGGFLAGNPLVSTVSPAPNGLIPFYQNAAAGANYGPGFFTLFANNGGIGIGNWHLSDPKPGGHVNGVDASVIDAYGFADFKVGAIAPPNLFLGIGLQYNLVAAGNYLAFGLTGQYSVQPGGIGAFGAPIQLTPVIFAADGAGGHLDFISSGTATSAQPAGLAGNVWGITRLANGGTIAPNDVVRLEIFCTAIADPDVTMDFSQVPPDQVQAGDFGSEQDQTVPEPSSVVLLGVGLLGATVLGWKKTKV